MNEDEEFEFRARLEAEQAQAPQYGNYDVGPNGERYTVGSPEAIAARSPVASQGFLQNTRQGIGKFYTDALLGARQWLTPSSAAYEGLSPQDREDFLSQANADLLKQQAAGKRQLDAPLQATGGGKVGQVIGAMPFGFLPGANTYAGAAAFSGGMAAAQPTVQGESRLANAGIGVVTGVASKFAGDKFTGWLKDRALQPFMGWKPSTVDSAAAESLGVTGNAPTQSVLGAAKTRFSQIFSAARDPNVVVPLDQSTMQAFDTAAEGLNASRQGALLQHADVNDLLNSATTTGTISAKKLGDISTSLRQDAIQNLISEGGDRAIGKALMAMREHVEDLIQGSIKDPELAQAYAAARPQYRDYLNITHSPTILNSTTGRINATALGRYLQGADETGYMLGQNQSPLYNAARWGQATGEGKGPPPFLKHFGLDWLGYRSINNPLTNAIGGSVSRLGAPITPAIQGGFQGLGFGLTPSLLPLGQTVSAYLEE